MFAGAEGFGYRLLSDVDRVVGSRYQVTRAPDERSADLPLRIAYLIDPEGIIQKTYQVRDVTSFADDVLADLAKLTSGP